MLGSVRLAARRNAKHVTRSLGHSAARGKRVAERVYGVSRRWTVVRQHNSQETRELIIGSAISLFIEKGYSHTTLEDIVRRVGLTRGAFYWNFKSKKDILDEVIDRYESFYRDIYASYTHFESAYETVKSFLTCSLTKKNADNPYTKIILYKVEACDELSDLAERQARLDREFTTRLFQLRRQSQNQTRRESERKTSGRRFSSSTFVDGHRSALQARSGAFSYLPR